MMDIWDIIGGVILTLMCVGFFAFIGFLLWMIESFI